MDLHRDTHEDANLSLDQNIAKHAGLSRCSAPAASGSGGAKNSRWALGAGPGSGSAAIRDPPCSSVVPAVSPGRRPWGRLKPC